MAFKIIDLLKSGLVKPLIKTIARGDKKILDKFKLMEEFTEDATKGLMFRGESLNESAREYQEAFNTKLIPVKSNKWSKVLKVEADLYSSSFRLTVVGVFGSYVLSQKIDIVAHHDHNVDVVMIHDKHYGEFKIRVYTDRDGSCYVDFLPMGGSGGSSFLFKVDDFVGKSFELGYTEAVPATFRLELEERSRDMGIEARHGKTIVDSKMSEGCINPNPFFILEDFDYKGYAKYSSRKLVKDVVYKTSNALYIRQGGGTLVGDHYISLPADRKYRASVSVRVLEEGAPNLDRQMSYYTGVICYDSDYNVIAPHHLPIQALPSGVGTLARELKSGDVEMVVNGTPSLFYNGVTGHYRSYLVYREEDGKFRYRGANGRLYREMGYNRNAFYNFYDKDKIVDNGDGTVTVTFRNPYQGSYGTFPIGSKVTRTRSGGSYNYWTSSEKVAISGEWEHYNSPWVTYPRVMDAGNYWTIGRDGTAYVKLLVLPNYYMYNGGGGSLGYVSKYAKKVEAWYGHIALEWKHKD